MAKMTHLLLAGAVALGLSDAVRAQDKPPRPPGWATTSSAALIDEVLAQVDPPAPLPLLNVPAAGESARVLQSLPQPRDLPASLFAPPPPPAPGFLHVDAPFFVRDPLLDSPQFRVPGWFAGAEIQVVKPHVLPGLSATVKNQAQRANGTSTNVALPSATLDWTVSPRVFLGYRLPSGFGEFMVSYRHLGSDGSGVLRGQGGPSALNSRLAFDIIDYDYNSRELSLWPRWDMKWTLGIQTLFLFFDSRLNQPSNRAAAGNGIFQARDYSNVAGLGPHAALQLARQLGNSRWSFFLRTDFSSVYHASHVGFISDSTTLSPAGRPLVGEVTHFGTQDSPIVNFRAGLTWQPSRSSDTRLFLGYQYEHFWALNRLPPVGNNPPSKGEIWDQGVVLQATINY
jgi:hypothetical protein